MLAILKTPLYFEDVEVGCRFRSPGGRTFTNAEVVNFAQFTGDYNLIHIDHEFARDSMYHENLVHGACVLSVLGGMFKRTDFAVATAQTLGKMTELRHIHFTAPVRFNDTVHLECEIVDKVDEGEEKTGLLMISFKGVNQKGETVLDNLRVYQIAKSPVPEQVEGSK